MRNHLSEFSYSNFHSPDLANGFAKITRVINSALDRFAPVNSCDTYRIKKFYRSVISPPCVQLVEKKRRAFSDYSKGLVTYDQYKKIRNRVTSELRKNRQRIFQKKIDTNIDECKSDNDLYKALKLYDTSEFESSTIKNVIDPEGKIYCDGLAAEKLNDWLWNRSQLISLETKSYYSKYLPSFHEFSDQPAMKPLSFKNVDFELSKIFPNKVLTSNGCGPDSLSGLWISKIWDIIKPWLETLLKQDNLKFTFPWNQAADQRIIKKGNPKGETLAFKQTRPIGVLNLLVKFLIVKPTMQQLRNHLLPYFKDSQCALPGKGLAAAQIQIIDTMIFNCKTSKFFFMIQYDGSNAFCCYFRDIVCRTLHGYNVRDQNLAFFRQFLENQSEVRTNFNNFLSKDLYLPNGSYQGQIGSDLLYLTTVNPLVPIVDFDVTIKTRCANFEEKGYVDDTTHQGICNTQAETISLVNDLYNSLEKQSNAIGVQINKSKTKIVTNVTNFDSFITPNDQDSWDTKNFEVLGIEITPVNMKSSNPSLRKYDFSPAIQNVISRLNLVTSKMTTARRTCKSWKLRLRMCTKLLFSSMFDIHILFCYITDSEFGRIKVAYNNAIRNTGFQNTTPTGILASSTTRYRLFFIMYYNQFQSTLLFASNSTL